jgi:hypothetical protein
MYTIFSAYNYSLNRMVFSEYKKLCARLLYRPSVYPYYYKGVGRSYAGDLPLARLGLTALTGGDLTAEDGVATLAVGGGAGPAADAPTADLGEGDAWVAADVESASTDDSGNSGGVATFDPGATGAGTCGAIGPVTGKVLVGGLPEVAGVNRVNAGPGFWRQ